MEDKRLQEPAVTDLPRELAEETRSLDSFLVEPPQISQPAAPLAAMADGVDPYDFDD